MATADKGGAIPQLWRALLSRAGQLHPSLPAVLDQLAGEKPPAHVSPRAGLVPQP